MAKKISLGKGFRILLRDYPTKAIELLYSDHFNKYLRFSIFYTKDKELSRDIVQEAFSIVWERSEELALVHEKPLSYFLARVVKIRSIEAYKRKAIQLQAEIDVGSMHDSVHEPCIETKTIAREVIEHVRRVIASFPKREKECLTMSLELDMSNEEIAAALRVTVKAVQRSLRCGTLRLQARFW